jgi:hypothetical protein
MVEGCIEEAPDQVLHERTTQRTRRPDLAMYYRRSDGDRTGASRMEHGMYIEFSVGVVVVDEV